MFTPTLTINSDGAHWRGTFTTTVIALVRDLVDEGPIPARLTGLDHSVRTVNIVCIDGVDLVLDDGTTADIDDLLIFEI